MSALLLLGCTVCYGDPGSPLSKGAVAGVVVLGIAILGMLVAFASLFVFWMRRARALERAAARPAAPAPSGAAPATR